MLVSIALTAATVCTACTCTKRLDETQWPETRDETYWAETETYCFETRPKTHRSVTRSRRDVSMSRDRLKTETSWPRPHPCCNVDKIACSVTVIAMQNICLYIIHIVVLTLSIQYS